MLVIMMMVMMMMMTMTMTMATMTLVTVTMIVAALVSVMTIGSVVDVKEKLLTRKVCTAGAHLRMLWKKVLHEVENVTRGL